MELILLFLLFSGAVGALIGSSKNRALAGFFWGFFAGIIGWLVIAVVPVAGDKCPHCGKVIDLKYPICSGCGKVVRE